VATGPASPRFFPGLETLRGIAALTVALFHVSWQNHFSGLGFIGNASLMVDFFFVLSGFVMFHSYGAKLRTAGEAKRFLLIRWGRLYPLHLVMLLVFVAIECAKVVALRYRLAPVASVPFSVNTPGSLIANLLLIHGLGLYPGPTWNIPSWSISVEFYTYALFALACLAVRNLRWFMVVCAGLSAAGLAVSWIAAGGIGDIGRYAFFRCILGFFAGVIARYIYSGLKARAMPRAVLRWSPIVLSAAIVGLLSVKDLGAGYFLCVPLFMALILATALGESAGVPWLTPPALVWLGTVSYSIYMVHPAIVWSIEFFLQYVLHVPHPHYYATGVWAGDLITVLYLEVLLIVSRWTYRHIEDRYRKLVKAAAVPKASPTLENFRPPPLHPRKS
jgi:peptidoglycan/LPS O-acetylase OafA/YrhL